MRQVNLLPTDLQQAERIHFFKKAGLFLLSPTLILLIMGHLILQARLNYLQDLSKQPLALKETKETRELNEKKKEAKQQVRVFYDENKSILERFVKKFSVAHMLKFIGQIAKEKVWLLSLSLEVNKGECRIEGKSFNTRLVSEFMLELKRLPYFKNVELVSMNKGKGTEIKEIEFQVVCRLR